ncbi:hypothetical protein GCM10008014_58660 [Paenibacillus silvae]|uniref:Uncharacterized protein n=1 Tax=Paenibacillus silvae TaxID=1325358 RepID=A0ABQ1ZQF3_9BACL|nr:hypothetical protein GCM10008014_58660 [Paenibacillus silvae]
MPQADRECREHKVSWALRVFLVSREQRVHRVQQALGESVEKREVQEHKVPWVLRVYRVSRE